MLKMSTSAIAYNRTMAEVVSELIDLKTNGVELAIGPRPSPSAVTEIERAVDAGMNVSAHANFAMDKFYHQDRDFIDIINFCVSMGIKTYSVHAPRKKDLTLAQFDTWYKTRIGIALDAGINFAIETMYPMDSNPYWLDSAWEVYDYIYQTQKIGTFKPIIADVAHLQICKNLGYWPENLILDLLKSDYVLEYHFSDNDGKRDVHKPYKPGTNNQIDSWMSAIPPNSTLVDEGRYKK